MKNLKIILQSNYLYIFLIIVCCIYSYLFITNRKEKEVEVKSYYEGIITDFDISDDKVSLTIEGTNNNKYIINLISVPEHNKVLNPNLTDDEEVELFGIWEQ